MIRGDRKRTEAMNGVTGRTMWRIGGERNGISGWVSQEIHKGDSLEIQMKSGQKFTEKQPEICMKSGYRSPKVAKRPESA